MKLARIVTVVLTLLIIPSTALHAADADTSTSESPDPTIGFGAGKFHITADRTLYHSNVRVHEAFGHVVMNSDTQRLASDYAWIDTKTGDVRVRGNVVFVSRAWTIQAAEMHFNINSGHGSIFYGSISNDNYRLRGQLIRKIGEDRFLTTEGEYTTCRDCAESWKMSAKTIDMTVDGYAFMEDVYVIVKDAPVLYLPYMIVPVKSKRQTGFLFPRVSNGSANGFTYVQPFFIAIDPHQDSTIGYGRYSHRGQRMELEHRYRSYDGIHGFLNGYYTEDRDFAGGKDRFAVHTEHDVPISKHFDMKLHVNESKDRDYSRAFDTDIPGEYLPALESSAVGTAHYDDFFVSLEAKHYHSLIDKDLLGEDKDMVQAGPSVYFGVREHKLGELTGNFYGTYDNFYREAGSFYDANQTGFYNPFSDDRIRAMQRLQLAPELSYSFRIADAVTVQPSVQYNDVERIFHVGPTYSPVGNLSTRYFLGKVQLTTTMERVYDADPDSGFERYKHQFTPILTYSNVPWFSETKDHPYSIQEFKPGGPFDQFDIVPLNNDPNNTQEPIGNAVSLELSSRLIRKARRVDRNAWVYPYDFVTPKEHDYPKPEDKKEEILFEKNRLWDENMPDYRAYKEVWLVTVNEAFDVGTAERPRLATDRPRVPFSPLVVRSIVSLEKFTKYLEYQYNPYGRYLDQNNTYQGQHEVKLSGEWLLKSLMNSRGTLFFKRSLIGGFQMVTAPNPARSFNGGFIWSFNDFFTVSYDRSYDLINKNVISQSFASIFNSPSECWQLRLNYTQNQTGTDFGVNLALNLMGTGYVGMNSSGGSPGVLPGGAMPSVPEKSSALGGI